MFPYLFPLRLLPSHPLYPTPLGGHKVLMEINQIGICLMKMTERIFNYINCLYTLLKCATPQAPYVSECRQFPFFKDWSTCQCLAPHLW